LTSLAYPWRDTVSEAHARRPLVVYTNPINPSILPQLDFCDLIEMTPENSRQEVLAAVANADALINPGDLLIDAELLDGSPRLRIIANASRGFDNLDCEGLAGRGIWATNVPDAFTASTAEVAMGLLLMVMRRMGEGDAYVRRGDWKRFVPGEWDGSTLVGKTIGLVGYGLIGKAMAKRAEAFDMNVIYHQRTRRDGEDGAWRTFDDLLEESDVVSLHTPLTPETTHLFNRETFAKMKPGAVLINTARGKVVEDAALLEALTSGHLGGAGLDVVEFEPQVSEELRTLPNIVITPHLGGGTMESRRNAQLHAVGNVVAVLQGREPVQPLNRPV
jgi:glyoxylate reductase